MRFSSAVLPVVVIFCQACGGGAHTAAKPAPVADPVPHTAGPPCADVAAHIVQMTGNEDAKLPGIVRARCTEDKWSDEARSCFATMQSDAEANGCSNMLTPAQQTAMEKATKDVAPAMDSAPPVPPQGAAAGAAPAAAAPPAPAPPPARHSRGATPKKPTPAKSGNPCDGGE